MKDLGRVRVHESKCRAGQEIPSEHLDILGEHLDMLDHVAFVECLVFH